MKNNHDMKKTVIDGYCNIRDCPNCDTGYFTDDVFTFVFAAFYG